MIFDFNPKRHIKHLFLLSLFTFICIATGAHALDFSTIHGEDNGDWQEAWPRAVSADGTVVIGSSTTSLGDYGEEAFMWTASDGKVNLGILDDNVEYAYSYARAVSADGSIIIGNSNSNIFRWTAETGMVALTSRAADENYYSRAMSADGNVIVGEYYYDPDEGDSSWSSFRWTEDEGIQHLDVPDGYSYLYAEDISADGTTIIGAMDNDNWSQAFRWTEANQTEGLGWLNAETEEVRYSSAYDLSADGSIIVGSSRNDMGYSEAFRWTEQTGMVGLGMLDSDTGSYAEMISADGSTIAGESYGENSDSKAFRWTEADGMVDLGTLGGEFVSARAISADGSVIVGEGDNGSFELEAFLWNESDGIQSIADILTADGVDISGLSIEQARDISADGQVIIGEGYRESEGQSNEEFVTWVIRLDDSEASAPTGLTTSSDVYQSAATMLPVTESGHALAQESLTTHLRAGLQAAGPVNSKINMYASGFGGEWNSYTLGGTLGMSYQVSGAVRVGGGLFASRYVEDDLPLNSEYDVDSQGLAVWADYGNNQPGLQLQAVLMAADLENDIQRGYMNGSGINVSEANPDGSMQGFMVQAGWKQTISDQTSLSPYASYTRSKVITDSYTETGGAFPAQFNKRKDTARIIKFGVEAETQLTESLQLWGQTAYGKRLESKSAGISGTVVGLMDFALPGYKLDGNWVEGDIGLKWQTTPKVAVMTTIGAAADNDQQPDWRSSMSVNLAF